MNPSLRKLLWFLAAWGVVSTIAGAFHLLSHLPLAVGPLLIAGLTAGFSVALGRVGWMREAAASLSLRTLLAVHVVRFIGAYFLWLHAQGRIPAEFAERAGWGDILTAAGALGLLFWPETAGFRRAVFWWNLFGIADLLLAVGTAGWLTFTRPGSMIEITQLPLTLIPLWAVPVLLVSHAYILRKHVCPSEETRTGPARA